MRDHMIILQNRKSLFIKINYLCLYNNDSSINSLPLRFNLVQKDAKTDTFFLKVDLYLLGLFFIISWRLITLQYCSGFCHTLT